MNKSILFWNLTLKQCLAFIQKNQAFRESGRMRLNECYRLPAGNFASRFFRLLLMLLLYVFSQQVPAQDEAYLPLNTKGLKHEKVIRALYYGQFERIPLADPNSVIKLTDPGIIGRMLFTAYVEAFSDQCFDSLSPDNKQEILQTITTVNQRRNAFGTVLSEEPLSSETKSTGTWADPDYANAYVGITNTSTFDALVMFSKDLIKTRGESMLGSLFYVLQESLRLSAEARHLIARHGCDSPQTKIYADNILDYVHLLQTPRHQFHAFAKACHSGISAIIPGSGSENCACLESVFRKSLDNKQFWELEDDFTERHVLIAAVSKVELADRVAQCIQ